MTSSTDNPSERRHFWRSVFHAPVQLTLLGETHQVYLLDISLKGALVVTLKSALENRDNLRAGQRCELLLRLSPEVAIKMEMTIVNADAAFLGLACDHIDLDSMTHLRNLVELNSGDPALLGRELSLLLAKD